MIDADAQRKTDNARKRKTEHILPGDNALSPVFPTPSEAACDRETRGSRADVIISLWGQHRSIVLIKLTKKRNVFALI